MLVGSSGWRNGVREVDSARAADRPQHRDPSRRGDVTIKSLHTDRAPAAIGPYSQAVVANGLVFTAGQIALDPVTGQVVEGDVVVQTEQVLRNLDAVLGSAGATWLDVVKSTVFLTDMRDFPRMNEVYARVMGDARPARSTVQVAGLPRGVQVEIDLVSTVPAREAAALQPDCHVDEQYAGRALSPHELGPLRWLSGQTGSG